MDQKYKRQEPAFKAKVDLERQEKELFDEDVFDDLDMLLLREESIEEEKPGKTND